MSRFVGHLWHFYQPPWQADYWIDRISLECYGWLSEWLAEQKGLKVNLNICASLTERLAKGHNDILENLGRAAQNGVVEFVDSAAYHAPLACFGTELREVTLRQIEANRKINRAYFGELWPHSGFFPPEMMFSPELSTVLQSEGYKWTITEDSVFDAISSSTIPHDCVATVNSLPVFFRSGDWSRRFAMQYPYETRESASLIHRFNSDLVQGISSWFDSGYAILAYDGETIGHHQKVYNRESMDEYVAHLQADGINLVHISELLSIFPWRIVLEPSAESPLCGSWSTTKEDILNGNYYPLWKDQANPLHMLYWKLIDCALEGGYSDELDKALNSCPLWWAGRDKPELVAAGARELDRLAGGCTPEYSGILRLLSGSK